ncbi:MAG: hypothetical protein COA69_12035 [Robiginitomaculum sp.]|nr:MAG: hypothetical protein COA69_12035 [Robiginitomaculum sp.]
MKTSKFGHDGKNYTLKGEWDRNTFTAQAFAGKKPASSPFMVVKEKLKDGVVADDEALENAVMDAAKSEVISGGYDPEQD